MSERGSQSPDPTWTRDALMRLQRDVDDALLRLRGSALALDCLLLVQELRRRALEHRLRCLPPADRQALASDLAAARAAVDRAEIVAGHVTRLVAVIKEWGDARCVDECRG